jgi:hypothetical protein
MNSIVEAFQARTERLLKRRFEVGFDLELGSLAQPRHGVALAPLVAEPDAFPLKHAWSGGSRPRRV